MQLVVVIHFLLSVCFPLGGSWHWIVLLLTLWDFIQKNMQQYLLDLIRSMMQDEHHVPRGVLYANLRTAVQRDLSENLNRLLLKNRIEISKTVNDILITLK